ncbi:MAG: NADH-quinone oxidoreductase subunit NuoF [Syntrophales bacterium]|nr:NADH-quinone oxidoreductase subunit NuoF [Syntrophales bacterium]
MKRMGENGYVKQSFVQDTETLRLSSVSELKELRSILFETLDENKPRLVICGGTACHASGSSGIIRVVKKYIIEKRLVDKVALRITGCHGFCEMGPFILTEPQQAFYVQVGLSDVPRIVEALLSDKYVEDLLCRDSNTGEKYYNRDDIPFFKYQQRSILGLNEKIDPIRIYDYIVQGGYSVLEDVFSKQNADWIVQQVKRSGLRGRGGAGFPAGLKWEMLAKQSSDEGKFLVCNADEGDPGAYMDRSVLEGNPHSIIEGMVIGAYGTRATEGIVYVRNEYPLAVKHLKIALKQAQELGLLGDNILGTGFSFDIKIVIGAGAFVCGEETALIRSIEGKLGEPRQRPPFPVQKGIDGKPTVINNVETWANIPLIFKSGADKFATVGTENNTGTKIFSLVGKIKNTGLVEVPMGITVKEIVYDIGGGAAGKAELKAVQTGGPSGGCIPANMFDVSVDYESLAEVGSIMGSGGMIVMDENTCMVDIAKYFMNFLKDESCGKCFTCRKGTQRMYEILDDISNGNGSLEHMDLLKELAEVVKDTTMCGLGQTASNPVLSTLRYFTDEYIEHIEKKHCPAGVCKALITFSINENCVGCQVCIKACPEGAITGEKKQRHVIDTTKCVKCGACRSVCKVEAVDVV